MKGQGFNRSILSPGKAGWLFVIGLLLILVPACTPLARSAQVEQPEDRGLLTSILKNGTLVIATDPDYPPQSQFIKEAARIESTRCDMTQYTANQMVGFDIDVAVEVARRLGVEPCFVTPAWSQLAGGNWGGRWDVSVGSMAITSERMEKLYFTQPYTSGAAVLFVHKDNQTYQAPGDLSGKRIGVCTGCAYEAYLRGTLQIPGEKIDYQIQDATIVGYDTDTSALADLAFGDGVNLDAVLTDPDTGKTAIKDGLPVKRVGSIIYHDYVSIAVDKNSSSDPLPLVQRITEIIQAMHQEGTLRKLSQHYYQDDFTITAAAFDIQVLGQLP